MTFIRRLLIGMCVGAGMVLASPSLHAKPAQEQEAQQGPVKVLPQQALEALMKTWADLKAQIPPNATKDEVGEYFEIVMVKMFGTKNIVVILSDGSMVKYLGIGKQENGAVIVGWSVKADQAEPRTVIGVIWEGQST